MFAVRLGHASIVKQFLDSKRILPYEPVSIYIILLFVFRSADIWRRTEGRKEGSDGGRENGRIELNWIENQADRPCTIHGHRGWCIDDALRFAIWRCYIFLCLCVVISLRMINYLISIFDVGERMDSGVFIFCGRCGCIVFAVARSWFHDCKQQLVFCCML